MTQQLPSSLRSNWAGNISFSAARLHHPESLAELQAVVRSASKVRVVGAGHSFNAIADTEGDLIVLDQMPRVCAVDPARQTVTVNAGTRYGMLCGELHRAGFALRNLASLPHITVAGAVATGTHGSGEGNANLSSAVRALELITAGGEIVHVSREHNGDQFDGMVVSLGALGVVTALTLEVVPTFDVQQYIYQDLPLATLLEHFDAIQAGAYSVSLFTDWQSRRIGQIWCKRRVDAGAPFAPAPTLFGATLSTRPLHPIVTLSAEPCTEQLAVRGAWHERLTHFRLEFTPSAGEELQSEYFVPRAHALDALRALDCIRDQIAPVLQISEIRMVAADHLWLSPCYQQAVVALHFTWQKDWDGVRSVLPLIEEALAPFGVRPHWGKLFTLPPERLRSLYPRLPDFQRLMHDYDPRGKFRNAFIQTIFGN